MASGLGKKTNNYSYLLFTRYNKENLLDLFFPSVVSFYIAMYKFKSIFQQAQLIYNRAVVL